MTETRTDLFWYTVSNMKVVNIHVHIIHHTQPDQSLNSNVTANNIQPMPSLSATPSITQQLTASVHNISMIPIFSPLQAPTPSVHITCNPFKNQLFLMNYLIQKHCNDLVFFMRYLKNRYNVTTPINNINFSIQHSKGIYLCF